MAGGTLRLRFSPDDEWSGFVSARAEANGFAGEGRAYFNNDELLAFAANLEEYPLKGRPSVSGGHGGDPRSGKPAEIHVRLACYPVGARGHLAVAAQLARPGLDYAVTLAILTTYEPLGRFARALRALVNGEREEAVLEGEP